MPASFKSGLFESGGIGFDKTRRTECDTRGPLWNLENGSILHQILTSINASKKCTSSDSGLFESGGIGFDKSRRTECDTWSAMES